MKAGGSFYPGVGCLERVVGCPDIGVPGVLPLQANEKRVHFPTLREIFESVFMKLNYNVVCKTY